MSEQNYTSEDLDRIFGPGAGDHAKKFLADAISLGTDVVAHNPGGIVFDVIATAKDALPVAKDVASASRTFYHLYVCPFLNCLKAANPLSGSWHQRGLHLKQSTPRTDVKCPGCGQPMVIARNGDLSSDANGNAVLQGDPIIQEAPGQPDQTAEIQKENAA